MKQEIKKYVIDILEKLVDNPNADFDEAWSRVSKEFRKGVGKPFLCGTFYDPRDNAFFGWNESIIEAMADFFDEKNGEGICCTGCLELAEDIRNGEVNEYSGMYYLDF